MAYFVVSVRKEGNLDFESFLQKNFITWVATRQGLISKETHNGNFVIFNPCNNYQMDYFLAVI